MADKREWEVAFISDGQTGEMIADFSGRTPQERPVVGAGETAEISWGADGVFRLRVRPASPEHPL